ncbi:hypothetical protein F5Y15DRAFT_230078 [Xylariaceae sp. FL0016]|nr:hypothetical protein F5Y15DRAFT_230078 [Xylariaceae sp. FL0016]
MSSLPQALRGSYFSSAKTFGIQTRPFPSALTASFSSLRFIFKPFNMKWSLVSLLSSALGASAAAVNYTDSNTGISFSGYTDGDGYTVGMVLPESPTTDMIIQMVAPIKDGAGWAGFDFGVSMSDYLLIVAWPNDEEVMLSPRIATSYATPAVYTGDVKLSPIANGTFVNTTHYSATFLCAGCITGDSDTFSPDDTHAVFAYAYSTAAVTDATDSSTALSMHSAGFGGFGMTLSDAKSAQYDTWAAMADTSASPPSTSPSTGSGSNSTIPATNQTVTYSNTTYDYIIAGAGPAGLVAAGRLAEAGASVLLIERGGASTFSSGGTEMTSYNSSTTDYDVPGLDYYLSSTVDASAYCTDTASQAGCLLGGSGSINAMMFVKPQDIDFNDKWPAGWKAADVSDASNRFFTRNPGTDLPSADGKRYDQGAYEVLSSFLGSNGFQSVKPLEEPNKKTDVFAHPPWNAQNSLRSGPVQTYLPLVEDMSNFKLSLNTKVIRAVRNGTWVSGVEVEMEDGTHQIIKVTANTGKVLLASGALSTPRILFYSGIGPSDQIQSVPASVNLPAQRQWIDLPVGKGLKDHPIITVTLGTKSNLTSLSEDAFTSPDNATVALFNQGSGLLTQSGQRLNFWTSVKSPSDGKVRYLQGTCNSPESNVVRMKIYVTHGLTSSTDLELDTTGKNTVFSEDPWLRTQGDKEAYEVFFDRLIKMANKADSILTLQLADGSDAPEGITGAELLADVNSTLTTGAHFVGTAKMGTDDGRKNGSSVVDLDTKVYGTDNLFVVDASMHPDLPTGNTQAIIMVAAEKAVERIMALDGLTIANDAGNASNGQQSNNILGKKHQGKTRQGGMKQGGLRTLRRGPAAQRAYDRGLLRRSRELKAIYDV